MENTRIEYQKLIDPASTFFFSITVGLSGFFFTLYLNFRSLPYLGVSLLMVGSFLLMIICLIWWKKIELLALYRDAKIEYLKVADPKIDDSYLFERAYLEKQCKERKYKALLPLEHYDVFFPKFLSKAFLCLTIAGSLLLIVKSIFSFHWFF